MDKSVNLQGFKPWGGTRPTLLNTTFYAEYNSSGAYRRVNFGGPGQSIYIWDTGDGYDASKRLPAEHILTSEEAKEYIVEKVFGGKPHWIDWSYKP